MPSNWFFSLSLTLSLSLSFSLSLTLFLSLSPVVGPTGRVCGVDVSQRMVDVARERAAAALTANVTFDVCSMDDERGNRGKSGRETEIVRKKVSEKKKGERKREKERERERGWVSDSPDWSESALRDWVASFITRAIWMCVECVQCLFRRHCAECTLLVEDYRTRWCVCVCVCVCVCENTNTYSIHPHSLSLHTLSLLSIITKTHPFLSLSLQQAPSSWSPGVPLSSTPSQMSLSLRCAHTHPLCHHSKTLPGPCSQQQIKWESYWGQLEWERKRSRFGQEVEWRKGEKEGRRRRRYGEEKGGMWRVWGGRDSSPLLLSRHLISFP